MSMNDRTTFGDWLRSTREKKGLTQVQAAAELEISGPTICRWETGAEPRSGLLKRVCRWGNVPPAKLVDMLAVTA